MVGKTNKEYSLIIGGQNVGAESKETFEVIDPATEETIANVPRAKEPDVNKAVADSRNCLEDWKSKQPEERGRILNAIAHKIRDNADRLAKLETLQSGKPLSQAKAVDVELCARYFEYYAGLADKIQGDSIPLGDEYVDYTVHEPLGVTTQIIPWNFPSNLFARSVAPALAAGNVAIAKPAEQTPLTAIELGKLALEAGLPSGVLNVVPGYGAEAGAVLASHPDVDGVSFTGSVTTGTQVAKMAVENLNSVHIEAGGKNPCVVFPDADVEEVVSNLIKSIFVVNAGQVCSTSDRLIIHENIHDEIINKLCEQLNSIDIGDGIDDYDMGPVVSEDQYEKVKNYIEIGREEVGEPIIGGDTLDRKGYFVEPTIFDHVDSQAKVAQEEIFGPVLSVITFTDETEAFELANDVDYGLVAGIFTNDHGRAHRFSREAKAGQIYINEWWAGGVETPFGGYKQSGFGREKGIEAVRSYTQIKNVCANINRE